MGTLRNTAHVGKEPDHAEAEITPWTDSSKAAEKTAAAEVTPTHVIDDFAELKEIIGSQNAMLFET